MNNRNDRVKNGQDVEKYLDEMFKNAEKHGITLQTVTFKAYRIGHGGMFNPTILEDDLDEIIEDNQTLTEHLMALSILGVDD